MGDGSGKGHFEGQFLFPFGGTGQQSSLQSFESTPGQLTTYSVTGTFNNWGFTQMTPSKKSDMVYEVDVSLGENWYTEFQIVVDEDMKQVYHPDSAHGYAGTAFVLGPDAEG